MFLNIPPQNLNLSSLLGTSIFPSVARFNKNLCQFLSQWQGLEISFYLFLHLSAYAGVHVSKKTGIVSGNEHILHLRWIQAKSGQNPHPENFAFHRITLCSQEQQVMPINLLKGWYNSHAAGLTFLITNFHIKETYLCILFYNVIKF